MPVEPISTIIAGIVTALITAISTVLIAGINAREKAKEAAKEQEKSLVERLDKEKVSLQERADREKEELHKYFNDRIDALKDRADRCADDYAEAETRLAQILADVDAIRALVETDTKETSETLKRIETFLERIDLRHTTPERHARDKH
jgi:hypothetical protein